MKPCCLNECESNIEHLHALSVVDGPEGCQTLASQS